MEKGKNGTAYNVGSQEEISIENLLFLVKKIALKKFGVSYEGKVTRSVTRSGNPLRRVLDCTRLKEDTGFVPEVSLEEGICQMFNKILYNKES
jgi:nucleoside-diphosphate-sugar epimerase